MSAIAIDAAIDGVLADLATRDVVEVPDNDAIPAEWLEDLAEIERAERALVKKGTPGPTYQRQTTEYF
jgi:hypothetical protein